MAHEVENILDRCIEEARLGRDPEAILRQHEDLAAQVRPLLALARELEMLPAPKPSASGVARLLARLATEGEASDARGRRAAGRRSFLLRPRTLVVAAGLLVALVGWALVNASAAAVPGDWLYPVKRFTESAGYALTLGRQSKAEMRVTFADTRLKEAVLKHQRGEGIDQQLLRAMLDETVKALEEADELSPAGQALLLRRVACSCQFQCGMLGELEEKASEAERALIAPFARACHARCTCVQGATCRQGDHAKSPAEMAEQLSQLIPPAAP